MDRGPQTSLSGADDLGAIATFALRAARAAGADEAGVRALRRREVVMAWRDGRIERSADSTERSLTVRIFLGGRSSTHRTSDLRPAALSAFLREAVEETRLLSPEGAHRLPSSGLCQGRYAGDLGILDPSRGDVPVEERRRWLRVLEAGARSVPGAGRIASVGATSTHELRDLVQAHSDGFLGTHAGTVFRWTVSVACRVEGGGQAEDWSEAAACHRAALGDPAAVGVEAARRALEFGVTGPAPDGPTTLVVEPRCGGRLLRGVVQALAGGSLRQRRSFLEGRLGTRIAAPLLGLTDEPLLPGGLASRTFDSEGLALRPLPLVEAGVLRNLLLDTSSAAALGLRPTTGEATNLVLAPGERPLADLLAGVRDGVLVTGFLGGNSNETTGDFSLGLRGFTIRDGRKGPALGDLNLPGNHLDLWNRLVAVGNDAYPHSPYRVPTLVFDGVRLGGAPASPP